MMSTPSINHNDIENISSNVFLLPNHKDIVIWQSLKFPSLESYKIMSERLKTFNEELRPRFYIVTDKFKIKNRNTQRCKKLSKRIN